MRARAVIPVLVVAFATVVSSPQAGAGLSSSIAAGQSAGSPASPLVAGKADATIQAGQEIARLRTWNSRTYQSRRGLEAMVYPGAVNYQDATGAWQQIDDSLVASALPGYAYQNRANAYTVYLPADLGTKGVRVQVANRTFEVSIQGAVGGGATDGNVDTYAGALPSTTVSYAANSASVEETLTLLSAAAPASFRYLLKTDGDLVARAAGSNRVDFVTRAGVPAFSFAAPAMRDSSNTAAGTSTAITLSLGSRQAGGWPVTLTPDAAWLQSPARRWPVSVDPIITYGTIGSAIFKQFAGADQDCYIQNVSNGSCSGKLDYVGHGGNTDRTLLQFNVQNAIPNHVAVLAADLGVYVSGSQSSTPVSVDASQITMPWTTGVTWTTSDGSTPWPPGGAILSTPAWTNASVGPLTGWYHWYFTQLSQGWVDGTIGNVGFLLKASSEIPTNLLTLHSSHYNTSGTWPFLKVTYQLGIGAKRWFKFVSQPLTDRLDVRAQVASGNLLLHEHLVTLKGTGQDLSLDLNYNNLSPALWDFGRSWLLDTGWDVFLATDHPDGANYYGPTGEAYHFIKTGTGFTSPAGVDAVLGVNGDGTYTLAFRNGEKYNFSSNGLLFLSATDKNGNKLTFAYDSNTALSSITDTQGHLTTFGYTTAPTGCTLPTASGLVNLITDPGGRKYQFGYDNNCNLTSYTDPANGVTKFGYDGSFNLVSVTDPVNNVSSLGYDTASRVTSATYPSSGSGYLTTLTYNSGNTVVKDGGGSNTTYYWDNRERVTKTTDPAGNPTTFTYSSDNAPATVQDPTAAQFTVGYDGANNPNSGGLPTGAAASSVYGDSTHPHLPTTVTDPQGNSGTYAYDTPGNLTKATDPASNATQYAYNTNGTRSSTTDVNHNITTYQYDPLGNLTGVFPVGPDFTYDSLSRVATMTDGKNQKTTYSYDGLDRHTKVLYADGTSVSFVYNAADDVTSMTDPTGTTTFTYDPLNRMKSKTLPGSQTVSYVWDANGNLTSETDAGGATTFTYNSLNELITIKDPAGATTTLGYDAAYRETTMAYPNGVTVTIGRDTAGEVSSIVAKNSGGTTLLSRTYSYVNPANGSHTVQRYSITDQAGNVTTYTYDGLNRLTGSTTKNSGGTVTDARSYSYDALGNRLSQVINGVTSNYTYNTANGTMTVGSLTYTFDADGNLVSRTDGLSLTYNTANLTTSMTPPGGSAIGMTYTGPDQSNRVTAGTSSFVYDLHGLSQRSSSGSTVYEVRDRTGQLLGERTPAGTYYVVADAEGSTLGLTDAGGTLVGTWTYDPWGNTTSQTGTVSTPFLFQGGYLDSATGFYKLQTRFYDPATGRWIQPSLNVFAPTQSRYAFQVNDPSAAAGPPPGSP